MLDLAPYSAHAATTKAKIIPNTIIMLPFLYFNYSLFNLFECKDNAFFVCAHNFSGRKCCQGYDFLISVKNCHDNRNKMAGFPFRSPTFNCCFNKMIHQH